MKRRAPKFFILTMLLCGQEVFLPQKSVTCAQQKPEVRCSTWIESRQTSQEPPTLLHVSIEDGTSNDALIRGIEVRLNEKRTQSTADFHRTDNSYLSWVDPETKSPLKITYDSKRGLVFPEKN